MVNEKFENKIVVFSRKSDLDYTCYNDGDVLEVVGEGTWSGDKFSTKTFKAIRLKDGLKQTVYAEDVVDYLGDEFKPGTAYGYESEVILLSKEQELQEKLDKVEIELAKALMDLEVQKKLIRKQKEKNMLQQLEINRIIKEGGIDYETKYTV